MIKFNCYTTTFIDGLRRMINTSEHTGASLYNSLNHHYLTNFGHRFDRSIDSNLVMMEEAFILNGRNLIFIENEDADYLLSLKFNAEILNELPLPSECFAISTQTNLVINGLPILPVLLCTYEEKQKAGYSLAKLFEQKITGNDQDSKLLFSLSVKESLAKDSSTLNININNEQLKSIIKTNDLDQIQKIMGQQENSVALSESEMERMVISVKLISSLCLYNHITKNKYLVNGFPLGLSKKPKHLGLLKADLPKFSSHFFRSEFRNTGVKGHHVRSGHFRQLVSERYYKGEYSNLPIGSRWVEVSPSVVGGGIVKTQLTDF